jgi:hypothetical protein
MPEEERKPYSYHTFLFPFRWDMNAAKTNEEFVNRLDKSAWSKMCWNEEKRLFDDHRDRRIEYNEHEYFHENVLAAIYGSKNEAAVINMTYRPKRLKEKPSIQYIIRKKFKSKKGENEKTWVLDLNAIRLKVFNTGVAIIVYELENYENQTMDDVLKINEFGRRIDIPYVSDFDNTCSLIADSIEISDVCKCDYESIIAKFNDKNADYGFLSPIVTDILGHRFTFDNEPGKLNCDVIGDDRMFVCCLVCNDEMTKELGKWNEQEKMHEWEAECLDKEFGNQSKLYEFAFIDGDGGSCPDRTMRLELLRKHIYRRWSEFGTLTAVTHHSLVCASGFGGEYVPFLTMRIQMAILVLTQRASIISLGHEAALLAGGMNKNIRNSKIKKIQKLQEKYVAFRNQLLFFEASAQEQAVELYKMLQESLYVSEEEQKLEKQLQNLHEIANLKNGRILNKILLFIGVMQVAVPILDKVAKYNPFGDAALIGIVAGLLFIILLFIDIPGI